MKVEAIFCNDTSQHSIVKSTGEMTKYIYFCKFRRCYTLPESSQLIMTG